MRRACLYILMIGALHLVFSQQTGQSEHTGESAGDQQINTGAIFDEIMQSLPQGIQTEIDSASGKNHVKSSGEKLDREHGESQDIRMQTRPDVGHSLDKLPDEVRRRVEKAMDKIERQQDERKLKFKESKK
ncbi:MAG: hypothetical protein ACOC41_02505 [Chitinivibrionales bacterium]